MDRRSLLASAAALLLSPAAATAESQTFRRVRPGDGGWPDAKAWERLNAETGGALIKVASPWPTCIQDPSGAATTALFKNLKNPYFVGDSPALTQTLGWTDAWVSRPSPYAVAATSAKDVAAAVNFARERRLRLVVKGGGHSYLGGSNAADSLLIWTRKMRTVTLHDAFTPQGSSGAAPVHAVSLGAGAIWMDAYEAVTTKGGRYVQGGGCTTVGVAGLVQSGGFGSCSKGFGTAAASLLEAEVVTADGLIRVVNAAQDPDLFFALKGGGGGVFGVVTRLTLRTHELPAFIGAAQLKVTAASDAAFQALVERILLFARDSLLNPHFGEQIRFQGRTARFNLVFQGITQAEASATFAPLLAWILERSADYGTPRPLVFAFPGAKFWDADFMEALPGIVRPDTREGAPPGRFFWSGDEGQVGQVLHGYKSAWLARGLLEPERRGALAAAVTAAAGAHGVSLHFNKGMAGARPEVLEAVRATATNPAVLDAFALAIIAAEEKPAYPGVAGHEPDLEEGRREAKAVAEAMKPIEALMHAPASYLSESDYFAEDWETAYFGEHVPRLRQIKARYDPDGLFFVHHGVGSDGWSADGFTQRALLSPP
jgi:FAD/FMN-containing dehydrogenase